LSLVQSPRSKQKKLTDTKPFNWLLFQKSKKCFQGLKGHFDKAGSEPKKVVTEFRDYIPEGFELGDELNIEDVFSVGDRVDVAGISKGTGFTGVMKRHNFSGVGDQNTRPAQPGRAPGSIGQASDPSRVFQGYENGRTFWKPKN
jgi:large subunit ribosomal protein L3